MQRLRKIILKFMLISLPAVLIVLLILELGLRLFIDVSDPPKAFYDVDNEMLRFEPNQSGLYVTQDISASYHINNAGWNNLHDYSPEKTENELRIAIIGDSYIEALQVDPDENVAARLEYTLGELTGENVVVYSFGISGAPLSQYLHMMRFAARTYDIDIFIINIVYNDFQESLRSVRKKPSFLQYKIDDSDQIEELQPVPYHSSSIRRLLAKSTLVRYLALNMRLLNQIRKRTEDDAASIDDPEVGPDSGPLLDYTFAEFLEVANQTNSRLFLCIDAPRKSIEKGRPPQEDAQFAYNEMAARAAQAAGIELLDLTPIFEQDFARNHHPFSFSKDEHWNAYAHNLAAEAIVEELIQLNWVTTNN